MKEKHKIKNNLKAPFESLIDRAVKEINCDGYASRKEALNEFKNIMTILINDLIDESYNNLKKKEDLPEKEIKKVLNKTEKILFQFLKERLKAIKRNHDLFVFNSLEADE